MAEETVNRLMKDFNENKQVKNIIKVIKGKNNTKYFKYPKINNNEIENNYIGTFCPMGFYNLDKQGALKIVPDRPMLSKNKQMENNLINYTCKQKACEASSNNITNIENFNNQKKYSTNKKKYNTNNYIYYYENILKKNWNKNLVNLIFILILILIIIYLKKK